MWNAETSARQMALWASTAPALSTKQVILYSSDLIMAKETLFS